MSTNKTRASAPAKLVPPSLKPLECRSANVPTVPGVTPKCYVVMVDEAQAYIRQESYCLVGGDVDMRDLTPDEMDAAADALRATAQLRRARVGL